jgi:hypothetical protein
VEPPIELACWQLRLHVPNILRRRARFEWEVAQDTSAHVDADLRYRSGCVRLRHRRCEVLTTDGGLALGGGIYNIQATATVTNSIFTGNLVQGGNGPTAPTGLSIIGVGLGGAIMNDIQATLTVSGSTFTGNEALGGSNIAAGSTVVGVGDGGGGGLFNVGVATLTSCIFTSNKAVGGNDSTGGGGALQVGNGNGGGIDTVVFPGYAQSQSLTVTGCTFTSNQAVGGAGNTGGVFTGEGPCRDAFVGWVQLD